jgi:hypothetical protein
MLRLARVGLLWTQNGSTGTPGTLLATGAALQGHSDRGLMLCLVGALWTAGGAGKTVAQLLVQAESYQGAAPGLLNECETVSEWVTEGSPGTINTVMVTSEKFQQLSPRDLLIVEIVLVCAIYGITVSASGLMTTATNAGFQTCDTGQLLIIAAQLYCTLS